MIIKPNRIEVAAVMVALATAGVGVPAFAQTKATASWDTCYSLANQRGAGRLPARALGGAFASASVPKHTSRSRAATPFRTDSAHNIGSPMICNATTATSPTGRSSGSMTDFSVQQEAAMSTRKSILTTASTLALILAGFAGISTFAACRSHLERTAPILPAGNWPRGAADGSAKYSLSWAGDRPDAHARSQSEAKDRLADVVDSVKPAVVSVTAKYLDRSDADDSRVPCCLRETIGRRAPHADNLSRNRFPRLAGWLCGDQSSCGRSEPHRRGHHR